jgi:predicted SpoU family rRNA methylase
MTIDKEALRRKYRQERDKRLVPQVQVTAQAGGGR